MKHSCPICKSPTSDSSAIVRNGHFYRKSDSQLLQRFYCKPCKKSFSTATPNPCFGQKKRRLNHIIRALLCSGVSMRRIARICRCDFKTVTRKMKFLATRAQIRWENHPLGPVHCIQFDDVETFEHTKCKPLSITLAVEADTRRILGFEVSQIAAKGKIAKMALRKYGKRKSERKAARRKLFARLKKVAAQCPEFLSDQDPRYPETVKEFFPEAIHKTTKGRRGCVTGQGELKAGGFDPLFSLNHTAAMLRANMNRLFRRTWNTTKKIHGLKWHLWIYMEYHNFELIGSTA